MIVKEESPPVALHFEMRIRNTLKTFVKIIAVKKYIANEMETVDVF